MGYQVQTMILNKLAKIDMRMFAKLIQNHHLRLVTHFNDSGLEQISQEFCAFQQALHEEVEFKEAIKLTENDAFELIWQTFSYLFLANSHGNTGSKFEDRPLFKLMSSTLITLEIPSAASTKSCPWLQSFCRGLASAFPNKATVESDFSIIGWEKSYHEGNSRQLCLSG